MFAKKAKSTALVLLNNAVRRLMPGETQDKLRALSTAPDFQQSPADAAFCESLCRDVLLDVRRQLAFKSPSHARTLEGARGPSPNRCIMKACSPRTACTPFRCCSACCFFR